HLVGAHQERFGNGQPNRLCRSDVEHQFELCRLLDRDVSRLRAAQYLIDMVGGAPIKVWDAWPTLRLAVDRRSRAWPACGLRDSRLFCSYSTAIQQNWVALCGRATGFWVVPQFEFSGTNSICASAKSIGVTRPNT